MTNGDKIRAMTDENLAVILMCPYDTYEDGPKCNTMPASDVTPVYCQKCLVGWLKEEIPGTPKETVVISAMMMALKRAVKKTRAIGEEHPEVSDLAFMQASGIEMAIDIVREHWYQAILGSASAGKKGENK